MNLNNWAFWIPLKRKSKLCVNRWYSAVPKTSFKSTEIKWKWELPQRHEIHLKKLSVIIMAKFLKFCNEQPSLKSATWLSRCRWSFRLRPTFMTWMSSKKSVAAEVILCYIPQKCSWYSVTPCTITWIKKNQYYSNFGAKYKLSLRNVHQCRRGKKKAFGFFWSM